LIEGLVDLETMRLLSPLMTGGGDVYRAQVVGYFEKANESSRAEVIIDATTVDPQVILFRDLSHYGRGFDTSVLGLSVVGE
ncbi:MAG: type II secretion system protein GspK, partial [Planctomycetota bacterium]